MTKRKLGVIGLKTAAVASSVGMPAAAVLKVFPVWSEQTAHTGVALGMGGFMVLLIALFGFRRQLWPLVKTKLHLNATGAIIGWGLLFAALLAAERLVPLLPDLRTICLAGLTGTGLGQIADTTAGILDRKKEADSA